jgi:hypothetical protein
MAVLADGVVGGGAKFNDNKSFIKYLKIFSSLGQVARRKNKVGVNPVLGGPRSSSFWVPRNLSHHTIRQSRTGDNKSVS